MVVGQVQHAIPGHPDVRLESRVAGIPALLESQKGVFVALEAASPVGEGADGLGLGISSCRETDEHDGDGQFFHSNYLLCRMYLPEERKIRVLPSSV